MILILIKSIDVANATIVLGGTPSTVIFPIAAYESNFYFSILEGLVGLVCELI